MDTMSAPEIRYHRRPLVGLFADLWRESATLLRDEVALIKAEISEKLAEAAGGVAALAAAAAVLFAGFLLVLLAIVGALALLLPEELAPWLAPLIVGIVALVVGWFLLAAGRSKLKSDNLKPSRSVRSMRQDAEVLKEHMK